MDENGLSQHIIGAAIEVHKTLGPGLLESVHIKCLALELSLRDLEVETEVLVAVSYKGLEFDGAYRMDMLVANKVVVELKVVEQILPVHEAQLLSYLRLSGCRLGLLVNFNSPVLKSGIRRIVNNLGDRTI